MFGPGAVTLSGYARHDLDNALRDSINATGYRPGPSASTAASMKRSIARLPGLAKAGNIYVNRKLIGAVVGVQPFGGNGLSGTGPKAGGPHYLHRLVQAGNGAHLANGTKELAGPVGERNVYSVEPRGRVLCLAADPAELARQIDAATAVGITVVVLAGQKAKAGKPAHGGKVEEIADIDAASLDAALFSGTAGDLLALNRRLAAPDGQIVSVHEAA